MPTAVYRAPGSRRPHLSPDGEWEFTRGGPYWSTIHVPTSWDTGILDDTLRHARTNPAHPGIYALLLHRAQVVLDRIEDVISYEDGSTISTHDHARGLLTWLADNHPELFPDLPK